MSLTMESMSPADIAAVTGNSNNGGGNDGWGGNSGWWIIILLLALGRGWGGQGGYGSGNGGGQGSGSVQPIIIDSGRSGGSCGCCQPCATVTDLASGFNNSAVLSNLNDIQLGQASIQQTLCQGFNGVNTTVLQGFNGVDNAICSLGYNIQGGFNGVDRSIGNLGYHVQDGFNGIQHSIDKCCCDTQRAIDGVNYNIASQFCALGNTIQSTTRDVIENANANSRAILDFLVKDKIDTLQNENLALRFSASQTAQNAFISANQEAQTAELIRRLGADCPVPAYVVPNPNCCYQYNVQPANNYGGCGCN